MPIYLTNNKGDQETEGNTAAVEALLGLILKDLVTTLNLKIRRRTKKAVV